MIGRLSCFSTSCKKTVEFICNCTNPETTMCRDHITIHLISLNDHKIASLLAAQDHIIKTFNLEKCLLIEIRNAIIASFERSPKELLRIKLLEIEKSTNIIEKIIQDYTKGNILINSRGSAIKIIKNEVNKNKNELADLILKDKKAQIDAFIKKLLGLKDMSKHRQHKAEIIQISTFDKYDNYIFSLTQGNTHINSSLNKFLEKCKNLQVLFEESIFIHDKYSFSLALKDINSNTFQCNLIKKYEKIPKSLKNSIFKIHNQNYKQCNRDFNYLYNYDENLNGSEIYIYNIESGIRTSTVATKSYQNCPYRLLDKITNIIKISNSHLLIIGNRFKGGKAFLMDIKTSAIREEFNFSMFDKSNDIIFYENHLFIFSGQGSRSIQFSINAKICYYFSFQLLIGKISAVLFKNYVLVSCDSTSIFYLYDLMIDNYSKIENISAQGQKKIIFTDNKRAYLWIQNGLIYESEENNLFQWNAIGNNGFEIQARINEITYSNYMGNLYISFIIRPKMYCYRFNKVEKEMELIYENEVSL